MSRRGMTDLALVGSLLVGALAALLVPGVPWPVEWVFGVLLLLVLPGYSLVAALAPEAPSRADDSLDWAARAGLTLVTSAIVVAAVGVLLGTLGRLRLAPAVLLVAGVTLVGVGLTVLRRRGIPVARRADPVAGASSTALSKRFDTPTPQTVLMAVAVVALVGALAFSGGTASASDPYSEVYLSQPDDAGAVGNETMVLENETMTLVAGEPTPVDITIANHEGETVSYGVVVQLERVGADGTVTDQQRLDRFETSLAANETGVSERSLSPSMTGERLRLRTLVFTGEVPANASAERADLVLRHWVRVVEEGSV